MSKQIQKDFTTGSIRRHLITFCMPFLLSNFVQACYSVADMLIVGRFCGTDALAGVTNGAQICNLIVMLISGLTVGGTVLVGQYFGARKEQDVKETIGTMFSVMTIIGLVLTAVMLLANGWVMKLLQVPEAALPHAKDYTAICLLGTVFVIGYNAISAVQRGMGESKRPLYFVTVAAILNVGLDLLLVGVWDMGAAGAAIATIASQAVSMFSAMVYLKRMNFIFDFKLKSFAIKRDKVGKLLSLGIPNSFQSVITNLSFLIMTGIVNGFGEEAAAAVGIVGRFNSFAVLPAVAMSSSVSAIAAQNIGAGLYDRAKKALWYGVAVAFSLGVVVFGIAQLFSDQIMMLFISEYDELVLRFGRQYMVAFSFDYLLIPFAFCFNGLLGGAGFAKFTLVNQVLSSVVLRMPVALLLSKTAMELMGVGAAAPIATVVSMIVSLVFILSGRWKRSVTGIVRE